MDRSGPKVISVAEAKKHLSEYLGRVSYAGEEYIIARHGKPMGRLAPIASGEPKKLADVAGWLDADDPFFAIIDGIVADRATHVPRGSPARRAARKR